MNTELIYGLIAPLGTSLDAIQEQLQEILGSFGWDVKIIHLSDIIAEIYRDHYGVKDVANALFSAHTGKLERVRLLQDGGDALRIDSQRGDILAIAAIERIDRFRREIGSQPCAYLIRSLKHPEELALLRSIYGKSFYAISAFSNRQSRIAHLSKNLDCCGDGGNRAQMLVDRDDRRGKQEAIDDRLDPIFSRHWFADKSADRTIAQLREFGQQLQGTFYQADLFVDTSNDQLTKRHIKRFAQVIFGNPFATPTKEEFAMFQARSVSLRSADLSRQVGAVIATEDGDIIASGANEVPKFGGGLHWARSDLSDEKDGRDFHFFAGDEIDALRMRNLTGVLKQLCKEGWQFSRRDLAKKGDEMSMIKSLARRLRQLHISQMGDFGRTVHAEMAALMDAVSRGVCVRSQVIYVTTFPCHQCAKHLIAAGIKRAIFIEPYPKSETVKLWPSEVANFETDENGENDRMHLLPFVGIAPRRYIDFFLFDPKKAPRRIDRDGVRKVATWQPISFQTRDEPVFNSDSKSYLEREKGSLLRWKQWFEKGDL